jgi:hypothetical protein
LNKERKIKEQYQNENNIIKQNEIELKEKINSTNRENNNLNQRLEDALIRNKNLSDELNSSNKKLNNISYELELSKN